MRSKNHALPTNHFSKLVSTKGNGAVGKIRLHQSGLTNSNFEQISDFVSRFVCFILFVFLISYFVGALSELLLCWIGLSDTVSFPIIAKELVESVWNTVFRSSYWKCSIITVLFRIIHRKAPVFESLFDKVRGLQACNFIKKRLQHRRFLVNIANF